MQPAQDTDYKKLLTDLIQKQIIVLGPFITLAKARNVAGLTVDDEGNVTAITGRPQEVIQGLIDQFMQLSGLIVRKTMEPLLARYPDGSTSPLNTEQESPVSPPTPQTNPQVQQPQPSQTPQTPPPQTQTTEPNQQTGT